VTGVRVAVLVSGAGSILEAMLAEDVPVTFVLADRPCRALGAVATAGIDTALVNRADYGGFGADFDRESFTAAVTRTLVEHDVDLIAMAGFGTVLSQTFFDAFAGRVLNTHPALLPDFPGWHAVQDALAAGVAMTGCTVHVATLETDCGPVLAQEAVAVDPGDTVSTLHERIKQVERRLYPATVKAVLAEMARTGAAAADGARR
jgi:phosphoribosylglycinamide formyltransferase-1